MNLSAGVSLGQLLLAFGVVLVSSGVAWGGLVQRIRTLEREVNALSTFAEKLARVDERTISIAANLDKLTGSWLFKEVPGYGPSEGRKPR